MTVGMVVGSIAVSFDGTYICTPAAVGFADPSTASSMAQAVFEQVFPLTTGNLAAFPLATQATVVDTTTTPPETAKGRYMIGAGAQAVAIAKAIVLYIQANAVAQVTTQVLGGMPASTAQHTPIESPTAASLTVPVNIPVQ